MDVTLAPLSSLLVAHLLFNPDRFEWCLLLFLNETVLGHCTHATLRYTFTTSLFICCQISTSQLQCTNSIQKLSSCSLHDKFPQRKTKQKSIANIIHQHEFIRATCFKGMNYTTDDDSTGIVRVHGHFSSHTIHVRLWIEHDDVPKRRL